MSAVPGFELTLNGGLTERSLIALLGAVTAAAFVAWLWSHVEARAVLGAGAAWTWIVVVGSAGVGGTIGWFVAVPRPFTLRWHQHRWSWIDARSGIECVGSVEPRLDLGGWMLLLLRSPAGPKCWAAIGRQRAGAAWHPLRATLYAPVRRTIEPGAGESAPR
jgi:hypothetical protein